MDELERKQREEEDQKKAEDYHTKKTPKFDVYGHGRTDLPMVSTLLRPIPEKILNTKYSHHFLDKSLDSLLRKAQRIQELE